MPHEEARGWAQGDLSARYYEEALEEARAQKARDEKLQKVLRPAAMPWERSRRGKLKHMVNEKMNARVKTLEGVRPRQRD